jgi:hypothetical protein
MTGRTTGKEISNEVIKCMNDKLGYNFTNLVAICIDFAPAMYEKMLEQLLFLKSLSGDNEISLRCTYAGFV